jgi:hypothetical protein
MNVIDSNILAILERMRAKTAPYFLIPLRANYCPWPRTAQGAWRLRPYGSSPNPANMIDVLF